jgi:HK97 family phage portal protein
MSLFTKRQTAPAITKRSGNLEQLFSAMINGNLASGGGTPSENEANRVMAVWRCQQMIAEIVAGLPVDEFRRRAGKQTQVDESEFVRSPSALVEAEEWRTQLMLSALTHGNAITLTTALGPNGSALKAETVPWSKTGIRQPNGFLSPPEYRIASQLQDTNKIGHMRAYGPRSGEVCGLSPIHFARDSINLSLAVRKFGQNWYDSNGHPTTLLSTEQKIDDTDAAKAKARFRAATTDDHIAVMGNGWKLESVQIAPDDALFLGATNATAIEICGYYGIPGELLGYAPLGGKSITYANAEQRAIDILVYTLQWWVARLERFISRFLPPDRFVKVNLGAFLRSDALTRWIIHEKSVRLGARSIDEVREFEDEEPLPDGTGNQFLWPPHTASASPDQPKP